MIAAVSMALLARRRDAHAAKGKRRQLRLHDAEGHDYDSRHCAIYSLTSRDERRISPSFLYPIPPLTAGLVKVATA